MKKVAFSKGKERSLIIFLFLVPKDLFYESLFIIKYTLENKIMDVILVNTYAIEYYFIDAKCAKTVCLVFKIEPQCLIKPK